jgi:hypothetical protein
MDEAAVIICNPIAGPHVDDVSIEICSECGREIWLAASTVKHANDSGFTNLKLVCINCAELPPGAVTHMPSDEQIAEIARAAGLSFDYVKAVIKYKITKLNRSSKFAEN